MNLTTLTFALLIYANIKEPSVYVKGLLAFFLVYQAVILYPSLKLFLLGLFK